MYTDFFYHELLEITQVVCLQISKRFILYFLFVKRFTPWIKSITLNSKIHP
jgi:hypothetical protein